MEVTTFVNNHICHGMKLVHCPVDYESNNYFAQDIHIIMCERAVLKELTLSFLVQQISVISIQLVHNKMLLFLKQIF